MSGNRMCMANKCYRVASRDLETWPLCAHCKAISNEIHRRWGPREIHDLHEHERKEVLGGSKAP